MPVLPSRRAHAGYWTPLDTPQRRPCYTNGVQELNCTPASAAVTAVRDTTRDTTRCGRAAEDRIYMLQLLAQADGTDADRVSRYSNEHTYGLIMLN